MAEKIINPTMGNTAKNVPKKSGTPTISLGIGTFGNSAAGSTIPESDSGIEASPSPSKNDWKHKCVVPFCPTVNPKGFSYFPSDPVRKKAWMDIFGLTDVNPTARICHSHFSESNFSVPKPTNLGKRRRLKFSAIPELNLPEDNLPKLDLLVSVPDVPMNETELSQATPEETVPLEFFDTDHDYDGSSFVSQTLSEMDLLIIKQKIEIKKLKKENQILNKKLENFKADKLPQKVVHEIVHNALSHSRLSKGQINWLLSKKDRHRSHEWGNKDFEKVCIL